MTQSSCAILERKMGGNGGRSSAAQRSKQLLWNQEYVPWVNTLPEFNRIKRTGVLLLLRLQTAFAWVCWACLCVARGASYLSKPSSKTNCHPCHTITGGPRFSVSISFLRQGQSWNCSSRLSVESSHLVELVNCTELSSYKSKVPKMTSRSGNAFPDRWMCHSYP